MKFKTGLLIEVVITGGVDDVVCPLVKANIRFKFSIQYVISSELIFQIGLPYGSNRLLLNGEHRIGSSMFHYAVIVYVAEVSSYV